MFEGERVSSTSRMVYAMYGSFMGVVAGLGLGALLGGFYLKSTLGGLAVGFGLGLVLGAKSVKWLNDVSRWFVE